MLNRWFNVYTFGVVFIAIWLFNIAGAVWWLASHDDPRDDAVIGYFGDSLAVANALFTGLGLIFLYSTLRQGQDQLKVQKDDLKLNRVELKRQAKELKKTNKFYATQLFESRFFHMLSLQRSSINHLSQTSLGFTGLGKLESAVKQLYRTSIIFEPSDKSGVRQHFSEMLRIYGGDFVGYLESTLHIVNYVAFYSGKEAVSRPAGPAGNGGLIGPDSSFYIATMASQLSNDELLLILAYVLSMSESDKSRSLFIQSGIFNRLRINSGLDSNMWESIIISQIQPISASVTPS